MQTQDQGQQRAGYLRERQVLALLPVSRATLWSKRWRSKTGFPDPEKLSEAVTAWRAERVFAWLDSRTPKAA